MPLMPVAKGARLRQGAEMVRREVAGSGKGAKIGEKQGARVEAGAIRHHAGEPRPVQAPTEEDSGAWFGAEPRRLGDREERIGGARRLEQRLIGPEQVEPGIRVSERSGDRIGGAVFAAAVDPIGGKAGEAARLRLREVVEEAGHLFRSSGMEATADGGDESIALRRIIGNCGAYSPDRPRPCRVTGETANDVNMQLTDDVAEGADIELVAAGDRSEDGGGGGDLLHQSRTIGLTELGDLGKVRAPRHEQQPGEAEVVHQAEVREFQACQRNAVQRQPIVETESQARISLRFRPVPAASADVDLALFKGRRRSRRRDASP